jgi:small subunit ribosomal protein S20
MPNLRNAEKALRQSKKLAAKNVSIKVETKKVLKDAKRAIEKGEAKAAEAIRLAVQKLDKAAQHGPFHKNKASRLKSRLMKKLNKSKKSS